MVQITSSSPHRPVNFAYTYNSANQRTGFTNADSSRWAFTYDTLGQVASGKRYWSDGTNVAGQQFEYLSSTFLMMKPPNGVTGIQDVNNVAELEEFACVLDRINSSGYQ